MQRTNWGIEISAEGHAGAKMELSPKQQAVNEIKNAKRILVLGHKSPDADQIGSLLALKFALEKLEKNVEVIVTDKINSKFSFLPSLKSVKNNYKHTDGKILRIDTTKIPVSGMKWQREDDFLNIYLEADKNLKFEFIEIINGLPKPDLIIVVDTPDTAKIDAAYDENTELFFEAPIINIDHHPGNEYYGTINLVDLTATSTAEILVSLFEALGIKIDTPDMATCLLAGILYDTQSFRGKSTTPKSLTVAAQLLAAGGRQQEIIANFYDQKPNDLMKIWEELLRNLKIDQASNLGWSKLEVPTDTKVSRHDVFGAADDLIAQNKDIHKILLLLKESENPNKIFGYLKGIPGSEVLSIAKLFSGEGTDLEATFEISEDNLDIAEKVVLKKISESHISSKKELWDVIETPEKDEPKSIFDETISLDKTPDRTPTKSEQEKEDAIEEALKSISQAEKDENRREMESLRDVIDRKRGGMRVVGDDAADDTDVFADE